MNNKGNIQERFLFTLIFEGIFGSQVGLIQLYFCVKIIFHIIYESK